VLLVDHDQPRPRQRREHRQPRAQDQVGVAAQREVDALYADRAAWAERALRNVAAMGRFSADRTIREYLARIWAAPTA
jgi:glucan phosphorylase